MDPLEPDPPLEPELQGWIARFRGPLVGLLASWGLDWGTAEEVAMDVFAEAWLGRARFRGESGDPGALGRWLRGIAVNLARAALRGRDRTLPLASIGAEPSATPDDGDERLALLRAAFAELDADDQTVLRMFYLEEASTREVAALLDITPKAVEGRLRRARGELRARAERLAQRAGIDAMEVRG